MPVVGGDRLKGLMAMLPAFATAEAQDVSARSTIAVAELRRAVDAVVGDGIDVIATTGSFGEFHALFPDEHAALVKATVDATSGRVPVIAGCLGTHTREVLERCRSAADAGADGVLVGVPFYFPSTIDNARHFYDTVASQFSDLAIMIYHNPTLHNVHLPISLIAALSHDHANIVAMKDSHRDTREMTELLATARADFRVFVAAWQYPAFADIGAAGFWSYDCWMDPAPHLRLRDAVLAGERATADRLTIALHPTPYPAPSLSWRETMAKLAIAEAGYCDPGPLRPPFVIIPESVLGSARAKAQRWRVIADQVRAGEWE